MPAPSDPRFSYFGLPRLRFYVVFPTRVDRVVTASLQGCGQGYPPRLHSPVPIALMPYNRTTHLYPAAALPSYVPPLGVAAPSSPGAPYEVPILPLHLLHTPWHEIAGRLPLPYE